MVCFTVTYDRLSFYQRLHKCTASTSGDNASRNMNRERIARVKYVIFSISTTCQRKNAVEDVNATPKIKRDFFRDRYTGEYCAKLFSSETPFDEVDSTLEKNITRKCETTYAGITTSVYIFPWYTLAFLISDEKIPVTRGEGRRERAVGFVQSAVRMYERTYAYFMFICIWMCTATYSRRRSGLPNGVRWSG